ncbi:inositol monophosphatase [Archaeoglobales archaeon]|nr:MAG: inositol monophosphatase [Archaeoglobales archaeon]
MNAKEALEISRKVKDNVKKSIEKIEGKGVSVGIGKDGTPTKKIDKVAEDAALQILKEYDVKIVSEEAGVVGDGDVIVALDPIDGTFNASRDIPIYSLSLCFSKSNHFKDVFLGYVYNLATDVEYYANTKAYKNGKKIEVSNESNIYCNAIIYYPKRDYGFKRIRIFGSAAIELCFVADGSIDCFIDLRGEKGFLRIYDVAAGAYITKCANAIVTDLKGDSLDYKQFTMEERLHIVAANKTLHEKIINLPL